VTPREFVSRVIDLHEFTLGEGWGNVVPHTFAQAAGCILMSPFRKVSTSKGGYAFKLECDDALGHTVIRASMREEGGEDVSGAICFTLQNNHFEPEIHLGSEDKDFLFETWQLSPRLREQSEYIISLLTYLTLKTNDKVRYKTTEY
jgi:hypothetical protein